MASQYDTYQTSLTGRYCSPEMSSLFSQRSRHSTWRKLWHVGIGAAQPTLYRVVGAPPRTGLWTRPEPRRGA